MERICLLHLLLLIPFWSIDASVDSFSFISTTWNNRYRNHHKIPNLSGDFPGCLPTAENSDFVDVSLSKINNVGRANQHVVRRGNHRYYSSKLRLYSNAREGDATDDNNHDQESSQRNDNLQAYSRRDVIVKSTKQFLKTSAAALSFSFILPNNIASTSGFHWNDIACAVTNRALADSATTTTIAATRDSDTKKSSPPTSPSIIKADDAPITHKVYINVRISRSDGTFNVRDNSNENGINDEPYYGTLLIGLFGKNAPNHVETFLSYIDDGSIFDDNPNPSYARSVFTRYDDATGLITGGYIPSLDYIELNGNNVFKYGSKILPASLWLERTPHDTITHLGKGLLTHVKLDATSTFCITTRNDTTELDRSHTVFGRILSDDSSTEFLSRVTQLPTYSIERSTFDNDLNNDNIIADAAGIVFSAQRELFRNAAKSLGDTRVSKVYDGKLLRRVEVTQVGTIG